MRQKGMESPPKPRPDALAVSNISINAVLTALSLTSLVVTVLISRNVINLREKPASEETNDSYLASTLSGNAPGESAAAIQAPLRQNVALASERAAIDEEAASMLLRFAKMEIDSCLDKFSLANTIEEGTQFCDREEDQAARFTHMSEMAIIYSALVGSKTFARFDGDFPVAPKCLNDFTVTFPPGSKKDLNTYFGIVDLSYAPLASTGAALGLPTVTCNGIAVLPKVSEPHTDSFDVVQDIAAYQFTQPGTYKVYWIFGDHIASKLIMVETDSFTAGETDGAYGIRKPRSGSDPYSFYEYKAPSVGTA